MRVTRIPPSHRLAPFIRTFTIVEASEDTTRVLIPDTGIVLGLRYAGSATLLNGSGIGDSKGHGNRNGNGNGHANGNGSANGQPRNSRIETPVRMPDASVSGMRDAARRMRTSADSGAIFAMFHEGGAARLFDQPLHELFGETVPLGDLLSPRADNERADLDRAAERLTRAASDAERVAIVEQLLLARYVQRERAASRARGTDGNADADPARYPVDPLVTAAVRAIRATRGAIRIAPLAATLGIGQDRLEKRFRRAVGTSPKQLASIIRLRRAIETWRPGARLADLSAAAGYFDQSHFTRELRAVTGDPPQRFFRAASEHC